MSKKLLDAEFNLDSDLYTEGLGNYSDGTTLRVIRTGWKGSEVIYGAIKFALENNFLEKLEWNGVSREEVEGILKELDNVVD